MAKKKAVAKKKKPSEGLPSTYSQVLTDIKARIQEAKIKASLSVNQELVKLYWDVGQMISERQKNEKWGSSVINKLGKDLQKDFPGIEGFGHVPNCAFYPLFINEIKAVANINKTAYETQK